MCYLKKCVALYSLPEGTPVFYDYYNIPGKYKIGLEKMCRSGWINKKLGICHKGFKSTKKGVACNEDEECATNLHSHYAVCRAPLIPGPSSQQAKKGFCDIEGNDDEWVAAQNAVTAVARVVQGVLGGNGKLPQRG